MKTHPTAAQTTRNEALHPLVEPTLFYDPPYERPLEDEFAWHLVKYLSPSSSLGYQWCVNSPCGTFWLDFVVELGTRRIAFELGDVEGETDEKQERLRDAAVIGSGTMDVLYRLRGADVLHRLHDTLALIARWEPELFSPRGHINLNTLASPEAQAAGPRPADSEYRLTFEAPPAEDTYDGDPFAWPSDEQAPADLVVRRFALCYPAVWLRDYDRALTHYGVSPDDLEDRWAKSA